CVVVFDLFVIMFFFFSSRRRPTRFSRDWSSDVCSSDLTLSQEEFLDLMFDGLELPNLVKRQLSGLEEFKTVRGGIANEGQPGRINIVRSLRSANMRRLALTGGKRRQLQVLQIELEELERVSEFNRDVVRYRELQEAIAK